MIRSLICMFCFHALTPVPIAEDAKTSDGRPSHVGYEDTLGISSGRDGQAGAVPTIADERTQADLSKFIRDSLGDDKTRPHKSELRGDGGNSTKYHLQQAPPGCHLEPDTGLCRAFMPRWYFNASDETCYKFTYGGCQGNENNFQEEHKCYATCKGEIPCPTDPAKVCRLTESPCEKATCPAQPEAECEVLPCTCEVVFEDSTGKIVECNLPVSDETDKISAEAPIGGVTKTSYVVDDYEGRAARPEFKNKTFIDFEVDDPLGIKLKQAPKTAKTSVNETVTTNSDAKISANDNEFIDKGDSDAPVTVAEDRRIENDTENYVTNYTTVTTTENAHNVTVPPPKTPGNIRLIGVMVTLAIIALLAIGFIAYKKWRRVMEFHYRTTGAYITEDRQCFTSSGGAGYGSGI